MRTIFDGVWSELRHAVRSLRLVGRMLFEVEGSDPRAYIFSAATLILVTLAATIFRPAGRCG